MSYRTTTFGPVVSLSTVLADQTAPHLYLDSNTSLTVDGTLRSRQTSASLTSLTLADGEFAVGAVSVSSAVLYFRSGVTTYRFIADAGAVI